MSVKIFAFLNPVSAERTILEANPGSVKNIITSLKSGFPVSQARVCRNGEIIKDFSIEAKDGDTLWIKFVPYGSTEGMGAGMKAGGWVLAIIGLVVGAATSWTGIGATFGVALIGAGLSMALGGTVLMNIDIPTLKDMEKPEQDHSIRGAKNQSRPHGRIPVLFGHHRIYPDVAANQYTEIKGNQQYFVQLFCGGYKDYTIDKDSIKLGDTPLIDLSHTKDMQQILSGNDPAIDLEIIQDGAASRIYPHCVHEEVINAQLQKEIKDADGNKISGEIVKTTPDKTDEINVDIFFHNGLGKYNKEGEVVSRSVVVEAWYQGSKDPKPLLLGYFNNSSNTIAGSELKTKRYQVTKKGLSPDVYTVIIKRVTADSTNSKVVDAVHVGSVRSKKSERPIRAERQEGLTIIAMKVLATAKVNGVIDSFNYTATSKLPVYSGNGSGPLYWLNTAETRNPAAMLLHALRGKAAQQIVASDDIDWPSIEAFYEWCKEHEYACNAYLTESVTIAELIKMIGNTARADILRIDSKISVVQDIKRESCLQLFTPKNTVGYSVTMFNADIPDAIALRFIDEKAGFAHNELSVYNTPDGNKTDEPDSIQKVDLWGITDDAQARRIGMYNYACLKNRPFVHTIDVDIEYLCVNKGDWIQYSGDIALTGSVQGRIKGIVWADGVCIGIDTDEPVVMTEGQKHAVRIRLKDGTIILKEVVYNPGLRREKSIAYYPGEGEELYEPFIGDMYAVDENKNVYYEPLNTLFFTEPMEAEDAPKAGNIYAFGVRGYEVIDLIITDIQPGQNLSATLTCVEYSPEIFDVDKPGFILPEFVNRITPVSGTVDHGVVNPDNWKHFAVFHDSEEEPERPSADGLSGGWYREQTFRSIWQSAKTAESVESGEWSLPVRMKAQRGLDDVTPIWLGLTPQNVSLDADGDGNIPAGLFPLTFQARLFQWNSVLQDVLYSLPDAPLGITIDANGLVTVNANAVLGDSTDIKVNAEFQEEIYTSQINIKKLFRKFSADYLGTVTELQINNAEVMIIAGGTPGKKRAIQDNFVLMAEGGQAGSVFQWTGTAWVYRKADTHPSLYIACFKDALNIDGLADNTEWFGAVIARQLIAQRAFIESLEAQVLKIAGIIYGGGRFVFEDGRLVDKGAHLKGFSLDGDGTLKASQIDIDTGTLQNIDIINRANFKGLITIESGRFKIVPDQIIERSYANITASNLRARIASDFSMSVKDVYSVSYGRINGSPYPEFDTIVFTSNGQFMTFYKNGAIIGIPGTSPPISSLGSMGITIKIGSDNMVMVYNAPGSTNHTNGIHEYTLQPGIKLLRIHRTSDSN